MGGREIWENTCSSEISRIFCTALFPKHLISLVCVVGCCRGGENSYNKSNLILPDIYSIRFLFSLQEEVSNSLDTAEFDWNMSMYDK